MEGSGDQLVLVQQKPSGKARSKDFEACRFDFRIDSKNGLTPSRRKKAERRNTHYNTLFKCKVCGNLFDSRPALLEHKMTHNDHKCPHCNAHFTRKTALKEHVLVHVWSKYPEMQENPKSKRGRQRLVSKMLETPPKENERTEPEDVVMSVSQPPKTQLTQTSAVTQNSVMTHPAAASQSADVTQLALPTVTQYTVSQAAPVTQGQTVTTAQQAEGQTNKPVTLVTSPGAQPATVSVPVTSGQSVVTSGPITMPTFINASIPSTSGSVGNPMQSFICINVPFLLAPQGGGVPGQIVQPQFLQNAMMQPRFITAGNIPQQVPILSPVVPNATVPLQPQQSATVPPNSVAAPNVTVASPVRVKPPTSPLNLPPPPPYVAPVRLPAPETAIITSPPAPVPALKKEDLEPGEIRPRPVASVKTKPLDVPASSTHALQSPAGQPLSSQPIVCSVPKIAPRPLPPPPPPSQLASSLPETTKALNFSTKQSHSKQVLAKKIQQKHALEKQQRLNASNAAGQAEHAVDLTLNTRPERGGPCDLPKPYHDDAIAMQREYNLGQVKLQAASPSTSPPPKTPPRYSPRPPPLQTLVVGENELPKQRKTRKGLNSMVAKLWQNKMSRSHERVAAVDTTGQKPDLNTSHAHSGHMEKTTTPLSLPLPLPRENWNGSPLGLVNSPIPITETESVGSPAPSLSDSSDAILDLSIKHVLETQEAEMPKADYLSELPYDEPPIKKSRDRGSFFKFQTCRVCKQLFETADAMWEHCHKVHQGLRKRQFTHCKQCSFVCTSRRDLYNHHRRAHKGKSEKHALKSAATPSEKYSEEKEEDKQSYVRVEVGPEDAEVLKDSGQGFMCSVCGKCFSSKGTLQLHLDTQHPEIPKQYLCEYSECAAQFSTQTDLANHLNVVHSHHMILMSENLSGGTTAQSLNDNGSRRNQKHVSLCDYPGCDRAFEDNHQLRIHHLAHTSEKPLFCELCEFTCRQRSSLNWHMKGKHGLDKKRVYGNRTVYIDSHGKVVCSGNGEDSRSAETSDDSNHTPSSNGNGFVSSQEPLDMSTNFADSEEEVLTIAELENSDNVIYGTDATTTVAINNIQQTNQQPAARIQESPSYTMSVMRLKDLGMPGYKPSRMEAKFHTCPLCKQLFNSPEKVLEHRMQEHREFTKIFCHVCGHEAKNPDELQDHMMSTHGKEMEEFKNYICFICGKGYSCKSGLNQHLMKHSEEGVARYTCPYDDCNSKLQSKGALKNHMRRVHLKSSQSQFPCQQEGCDRKFDNVSALRAHQLVHMDERLLPCNYPGCDRAFRESKHLKVHRMQHTDEKPMKCFLCDYSCRQRNSMNWHMKSKHNMMKQVSPDGRTVYVPV